MRGFCMKLTELFQFCPRCGNSKVVPSGKHSTECPSCGFEIFANSAAAVGIVIFNPQNEILMCVRKNDPGKGLLDLPGGFVEPGETAEDACSRELYEELNLKLNGFQYMASYPNEYLYKGMTVFTLDLFFIFKLDNELTLHPGDDVSLIFFAKPDDIEPDKIAFESHRKIIKRLREK